MQKRWLIKEIPAENNIQVLMDELQIDRIMATLLLQRGIENFDQARSFFRPNIGELHDPFVMKNMNEAVLRLIQALEKNQKILLFGDYDVDGTSAVALMWNCLKPHSKHIDFYIPDRYAEGYGLSTQGIDYAKETGVSLLITLDCGIKAVDKIDYARSLGIDVIVCDHHEPGEQIPDAWVLDPKQKDCSYPYKELSGCGVGFKLMQALYTVKEWDFETLMEQFDLLAISIAADIVPITGENRILCYHGLKLINAKPRKGIVEILKTAQKSLPLSLTNVVFIIAPRINAAGRIHSGRKAVELLISNDEEVLIQLAEDIHADNETRKKLDAEITQQALDQIENDARFPQKITTLVFQEDWHKGVIGIVASRLIEKHYRPTIVLTESNGKITGSARSISGLDIHEVLTECEDLLEQFGGHYFAAGMTLLPENLSAFRDKFEQVVQQKLSTEDRVPMQKVDVEIHFSSLFQPGETPAKLPKFKRVLNQLEPHGPQNMKPVFCAKNVFVMEYRILKEEHLKISVKQPDSPFILEAIGFNMVDKLPLLESQFPLDILFTLESNSYNDKETLQLNLKDIRTTY
jgi:single-stranded-DNA-specific exonuclease